MTVSSHARNQAAIIAAAFVGFTGFTLVMPFVALYIQELGVTDTQDVVLWAGITLGVTPALSALVAPLWGRVGDRFGNKILVQRSLVSCVLVMVAMAYATRAWHLFALRAVQGLVAGYGPVMLSMTALSAPREKMAAAIGQVQTAQRVAPAIGPVVGGLLAAAVGLRNTFFVSAGAYILALLMVTVLYHEPKAARKRDPARERITLRDILRFENFALLMAVIFGLQLVDRSFGPILLLYLDQLGYGAAQGRVVAGLLFSVLALSGAIGNQIAAVLLKRMSARDVITASAAMGALALGGFALTRNGWVLGATIAGCGAAIGVAMTAAFTAGGAVIPRHAHGRSFGFLTGASLFGLALSPVISGLVAALSIRLVFVCGILTLLVLAVLVRRMMNLADGDGRLTMDEGRIE